MAVSMAVTMTNQTEITHDHIMGLFIDADNVTNSKLAPQIMKEVGNFGSIAMKRIYGDWTSEMLQPWNEEALKHGIKKVQVTPSKKDKNSTDIALAVDVMDVLHDGNINGFCIVSTDCDFSKLAETIREHGKFVIGIGPNNTPTSLKIACYRFITMEMKTKNEKVDTILDKKEPKKPNPAVKQNIDEVDKKEILDLISKAYEKSSKKNPIVTVDSIGQELREIDKGLKIKKVFGKKQITKILKMFPDIYEIKNSNKPNASVLKVT